MCIAKARCGVCAYTSAFSALSPLVCYAVKANGNLSLLKHFASLGSGFDIVSGGELARVLAAGGDAGKTIFSGVGKKRSRNRIVMPACCVSMWNRCPSSTASTPWLRAFGQNRACSCASAVAPLPPVFAASKPSSASATADAPAAYRHAAAAAARITSIGAHQLIAHR